MISLLGQFEVRLEGQPVTGFQSDKSRSLLAYLAVEADRPLRREFLATLFWPDAPEQTARTNLRSALLNLRQLIGDTQAEVPYLIVARESIQFSLDGDVQVDVAELQRLQSEAGPPRENGITSERVKVLEAAAVLYRGNFLEGLSLKDCQEFEDWCYARRERLREQASSALWQIGEYYDRSGQYTQAIRFIRQRVELEPWQEEAHYHLMRLLALNGERAAALAQYETCRRHLMEHLGVEPSADTERLYALVRDWQLNEMRRSIGDVLPAPGEAPFKGLQFFDVGDAGLFFGREELTLRLAEHLRQMQYQTGSAPRAMAVVGASGSGKSSLVRAGLAALLKRSPSESQAGHDGQWNIQIITPGAHPLAALNSLEEGRPGPSLLVVDQFEELFTLCHSEAEASEFTQRLLGLEALVVIALRADFYVHCSKYPALRQALSARQEFLGAMTAVELRRAIVEPAQRSGWELEQGLVDLILRDLGAGPDQSPEPGALPLLSLALLETWRRRSGFRLTLRGYQEAGGVSGVIAKTAETIYAGLDAEQQALTRRIFLRLTELGEGIQDTRRRIGMAELVPAGANREVILEVVHRLASARLLVTEMNPASGQEEVEMAHEALIRHWPRLRGWLEENRAELRLGERVRDAAQEWQAARPAGRADNLLVHRGERLDAALQAVYAHRLVFNQNELDYLVACRGLRERERAAQEVRRNWVIITVVGISVFLALAAYWGLSQAQQARRQAEISLAQQLAAQADEIMNLTQRNQVAALLTIESIRHSPERSSNETLAEILGLFPKTDLRLQMGARVSSLALSQDGRWLAAGAADPVGRVWDAYSGKEVAHLVHESNVTALAFSPDGQSLVSGEMNGTVRVWETQSGRERVHLDGVGAIWAVAFSPDGTRVAAAGENGGVWLWDAVSGKQLAHMAQAGAVYSLHFSPDGARLLSAGQDRLAHLWDGRSGKELSTLTNSSEMWVADFSPDGHLIVTAGWDGAVRVWDASSGEERSHMLLNDNVRAVAFNPDGVWLATASDDGTARVWDVENGRELARMQHGERVLGVAFSPDGQRVVSGGEDGTARVWEADNGREITRFQHAAAVTAVAFTPDGKQVVSGGRDGAVRVWQAQAGRELVSMQHDGRVSGVVFSPDGKSILSSSEDGLARIWDAQSGGVLARMVHGGSVYSAAFSPDGKLAISAGTDSTVRIWQTATGFEVRRLKLLSIVWAVAFSPDGLRILSGGQNNLVRLWDANSGQELIQMSHEGPVSAVAFSPDGKWAVSASLDKTVRVWELSSGRELIRTVLAEPANAVRFSPDGKMLAAAGKDGLVHVWVIASMAEVERLKQDGPVTSLAFMANGQYLVSGSQDHTARVWEVSSGREVSRARFDQPVSAVAFSPDGQWIVSGAQNGDMRVWLWRDADLIQLACARLERNLSLAEWKEYMGERAYQSTCPNLSPGN